MVLRPLKVVIENYPEGQVEQLEIENNPEQPETAVCGPFLSRELYIEQEDFMEEPVKKFFRLAPGNEVRLKSAYFIKCERVIKDEKTGEILELRCTYDPKRKAVQERVRVRSKEPCIGCPPLMRLRQRYGYMITYCQTKSKIPQKVKKILKDDINPNSMEKLTSCMLEPSLANATPENRYQFLRNGYFCLDAKDSTADLPVFNRVVGLRDSWAKTQKAWKKSPWK